MLLFYRSSDGLIARSLENVVQIVQFKSSIKIFYRSGSFGSIDLFQSGAINSDIVCDSIKFDSENDAINCMRSFYVSCVENKKAFFFDDRKGVDIRDKAKGNCSVERPGILPTN